MPCWVYTEVALGATVHNAASRWYALNGEGLLHLGAGRFDDAIDVLEWLERLVQETGTSNPTPFPYRGDLIEALIRGGRVERAEELTSLLEADAERTGLAWPRAVATRARAILAGGSEADCLFEAALDLWPDGFEGGRTRLCWAESLRRRRQLTRSRVQSTAAAETFDRLGALSWAARARAEMRAGGARPRPAAPGPLSALTPQELQVATVIAQGHSNKEAASALFMSPKTVEHHLSRVYTKLGLRSRTELARLMAKKATAPV